MNFPFLNPTPQGGTGRSLVTVVNFFESEGNIGYFKQSTFKSMMDQMQGNAPGLYRQYVNLFDCVKDGFNIKNTISKQTHRVSQSEYFHLRFGKGKMQVEATIYEVEGMGRFISEYANGLIQTDFTLAEFIKACDN